MEFGPDVEPDAFVAACPSRQVMARLGEKWTMLAIVALQDGPMRFGALQRKIEGVSQKMLSQTLRNLEADGLVLRRAFDEMPLRVEYQLTEKGTSLLPLIHAIKRWAEENLAYVTTAREAHGLSQRASLGS